MRMPIPVPARRGRRAKAANSRIRSLVALAAGVLLLTPTLAAQWPRLPAQDVPRLADGELDYEAPPPRTADGKPDFTGLWQLGLPGAPWETFPLRRVANPPIANGTNIGMGWGGPPLTPWGEEELSRRRALDTTGPRGECQPLGVVQFHTGGGPRQIVQRPEVVVILYEFSGGVRQIFTDGRTAPRQATPRWYGYSAGRWEGDTLVVETTGFRDDGWLDTNGSPLTAQGTVIERFRRPTYGRMEIDVTVTDPKAYTKPWTVRVNQRLAPGEDLMEFVCLENHRGMGGRR